MRKSDALKALSKSQAEIHMDLWKIAKIMMICHRCKETLAVKQVRHPNEAEDMRKADENIIQIMFMELKVQQLKLVGVANAKAVIARIAESAHLAKTNLDSVVAEPKKQACI